MNVAVVCPFSLERLTGTPIRALTTITAVASRYTVVAIARAGKAEGAEVRVTGPVGLFSFTRATIRHLRECKPDIVHGLTTASIVPLLIYKWVFSHRVHIVFEMHGWAWFEQKGSSAFPKRLAFTLMDYFGLWFAGAVIAVSKTEKAFLSKRTRGAERIFVVWDPIDFENDYHPPAPSPSFTVGYIGNAAWWQGLQYLIDSARLLQNDTRISFKLAGFDSTDTKKFPPLPRVAYVGRVERVDVISFLETCDVLVSPRLPEGVSDLQFPHKLSEYLAVGRPVIVSSASDQPEVVRDGKCGLVANPLSGQVIAECIQKIAALSPEERAQWGKRAYTFARENLQANVFGKKVEEVYTAVMR